MYERKTPLDLSCGTRITMCVIGAKWKPCLIDLLRDGAKRPNEIHKSIPEATPRVLNQQLKELEEHGVISKIIFPELPPRSEYFLTDVGKDILPILDVIEDWGEAHRECFSQFAEKKNDWLDGEIYENGI